VADSGFRLGIDFGTSNTVAVLRWPDGHSKPLLFDGSPLLPSAVYVDMNGTVLTGRDAVHSARLQPHRFEPYPKRRLEDGMVWLADREIPVVELVANVLRRVVTEAQRVAGTRVGHLTLSHPAAWASQRREALSRAAVAAGLPTPALVAEPVAAASYFVGTVGTQVPVGGFAVVYDFGAGTFDATVVRRSANGGFDVLASEGLPDAGGLDVDAAFVAHLGKHFSGRDNDFWQRLTQPSSETDRRAAWQFWEDARLAKEMLSRAATTYVHVPLFDESAPVGREELEQFARPILDRTVTATQLAVASAGLATGQLSAIFLVGGSSRIPLAATLLHRAFGLAPTAIEQPELVVAEGALSLAPLTGRAVVSGPTSGGPVSDGPVSGGPVSGGPVSGGPVSGGPVSGSGAPVSGPPVSGPPVSGAPVSPSPISSSPVSPSPVSPMPAGPPAPRPMPAGPPAPRPMPAGPPVHQQMPPVVQQGPPVPVPVSPGYYRPPPPTAPRSRRPLIVGGVAAGVVAIILTVVGIVWGATRGPGTPGGDDPTSPVAVAASPACGYKLAYLGVLTGSNASDGKMIRDSVKLAIKQFTDKHPNCSVELVEEDTEVNEEAASEIAADPRVLGVIGPVYSTEVLDALPALNAAGLATISPSAADPELTRKGWKVFHRLLGTDLDQAAAGARYLTGVMKAKRTYVVSDDTNFGIAVGQQANTTLGSAVIGSANIKRADKDFSSTVARIVSSGADSVYYAGFWDDGAILVKQLRTAKPSIAVVAADRVFTDSFVKGAGAAADGVIVTCPCIPSREAGNNFSSEFEKVIGRPSSYYGPEAYDAANVLLSGLTAGKSTRADMLAYVKAYEGQGISRSIKFADNGDLSVKNLQVWAYKVSGGYIDKEQAIPD
jgi:ABC-type branched-subunit amino acid transport system substrate-binding protein